MNARVSELDVSQSRPSPSATNTPPNPVPSDTPRTSVSWSEALAVPSCPGAAVPRTVTEMGA
jgi:hypothetical protein